MSGRLTHESLAAMRDRVLAGEALTPDEAKALFADRDHWFDQACKYRERGDLDGVRLLRLSAELRRERQEAEQVIAERDRFEDQLTDVLRAIGWDGEWSNMTDEHHQIAADIVAGLKDERDAARREACEVAAIARDGDDDAQNLRTVAADYGWVGLYPACPKCDGRGLIWSEDGRTHTKCTTCGGSGEPAAEGE